MNDEPTHYSKVIIGHSKCDWSKWTWVKNDGAYEHRVSFEDWMCPMCCMYGTHCADAADDEDVNVPLGCVFIFDEFEEFE